jgi:eukaryotic-like serine/threonine-protein kinase
VTTVDSAGVETSHGFPQFLPDGDRFLYFVSSDDASVQGVYVSALSNARERRQVLRTATRAAYVPPHEGNPPSLLWMRERTLLAQHIDPDSLQLQGDPAAVAENVSVNIYNSRAAFSVSDAGLLAYFSGSTFTKRPIVWVTRDGRQQIAATEDTYWNLDLAPGAERMAVSRWGASPSSGQPNLDVWVHEFARGVVTRLPSTPARDGAPAWSPDGKQVAFSSARESGRAQVYRAQASGEGEPVRLTDGPGYRIVLDWSNDGRYILYENGDDLMAVPPEGGTPIPVVRTPFAESDGAISPDGRWIAFAADYSGRFEIYVQRFLGADGAPEGRSRVSTNGGRSPRWRGNGRELYYQNPDGRVMAAAIQPGPLGIQPGMPHELLPLSVRSERSDRQFDVTSDGQRFLIILAPNTGQETRPRLTVVSNWQATLRQ